ncbi:MAG: hypothetical protein K6E92_10650 [Lachnospiraceae bacterium]|nr:hypothetical protein [Lachnospiraceae bacterium]
MEERKEKTLRAAGILLFVLLLVCIWLPAQLKNPAKSGYDVVLLGDSMFAHAQGEGSLADELSSLSGLRVADASFGGSAMAYRDLAASPVNLADTFCMAALSQAICARDFRVQKSAEIHEVATEYFPERIRFLETVDLAGSQVLLIDHLANDYFSGVPIEDGADPYNEYTYAGALRSSIRRLRKTCPDLRIILVSCGFVWYTGEGETGETRDCGGGTLPEYVAAQEALARELGLEWIDLYHGVYPGAGESDDPELWMTYTADGVHPDGEGQRLIAKRIAAYLTGETPDGE